MINYKKIIRLIIVAFLLTSCFEDLDDNPISTTDINDFVWKGLNRFYLYKDDVTDLDNNRFTTDKAYTNYLNDFSRPEDIFENLIYQPETIDRFSWITDDYIALEQRFKGTTKSNGLEFDFYFEPGSSTNVFGIIKLVINNSPADNLNLQRGQLFNAVNGTQLTENNFNTLLNQDAYTLHFANYNDQDTADEADDTVTSSAETTSISKVVYTENPIHKTEIIAVNGVNIGYLMYNGFTPEFNKQLNNAFAEFKANNVQQLVLDLRYNPGGSVNTSTLLGSMITGQFKGELYTKLEYNSDLQDNNTNYNFTNSFSDNAIISLNLGKVYVLTTERSASASEMIINSLSAYIDVIQIGEQTTGKSQASITLYDSPNFRRQGANPNHFYAMQPLVAKTLNKFDESVPASGFYPTIPLEERPANYGTLGNENEPLLAAAIQHITDNTKMQHLSLSSFKTIKHKVDYQPLQNDMYIE